MKLSRRNRLHLGAGRCRAVRDLADRKQGPAEAEKWTKVVKAAGIKPE